MKLYYSPGACSLASHITARELGLDVGIVKVDLSNHTTESGADYYAINPKGYVPYFEIDAEKNLSEGVAILQYMADLKPEKGMTSASGTFEQYKLQEMLTFISSEVHKAFSPLWTKGSLTEEGTAGVIARLQKRFATLDEILSKKAFLMGDAFTIADAYAFTILNWRKMFNVDISAHKHLSAYLEKVASRESVQTAMKEEGLI